MAYKPAAPPDKRIFPGISASSSGLSTPINTGYNGYSGYKPAAVDQIIIDDTVVAVLIDSTILGAPIWFALVDSWAPEPSDKTPVFYASDLPALRQKTADELKMIFNAKQIFGGGVVRQ